MSDANGSDAANRDYYRNHMATRRARVTVDVDVEWRQDEPGYSIGVLEADGPGVSVRVKPLRVRSVQFVDEIVRVNRELAVYDPESDEWSAVPASTGADTNG